MNAVLGLSMLLFGQVVLPNFDPGAGQSAVQSPTAPMEQGPGVSPDMFRARQGGMGPTDRGAPFGGSPMTRRLGEGAGTQEPYVPIAPTDPSLSGNESWATPTQGASPGAIPQFGSRTRMSSGGRMRSSRPAGASPYGTALGRGPSVPNRAVSENLAQQVQANRMEAARSVAPMRGPRPFSNYTPAPTQSAYSNIFRPTANGTINNYSQLVRPQLEQQQENRAFGGQIRGLQSASRLQSSALLHLGKSPMTTRGTMAPEFYMNHGDFYPAFR